MTESEVFELIVKHAREVMPELHTCRITPEDRLVDFGANSVDRMEIISMTLCSLSLKMPLAATLKANNVGQLAALLHERL
jgi:polyketide biosynthesis acyl carrier protein